MQQEATAEAERLAAMTPDERIAEELRRKASAGLDEQVAARKAKRRARTR